jgi:hypothetical protein
VEIRKIEEEKKGLSDKGEMWRSDFENENFVEEMMKMWKEVEKI